MFKGKVALITGATSGIGRSFLEKFSKNGASVIFNGFPTKAESIKDLQNQIKSKYGTESYYYPADSAKPSELEAMVEAGTNRFSKIDILINNAGIPHIKPSLQTSIEEFSKVLQINVLSHYATSMKVVPLMIKQKWGRVINISSIFGLVGSINSPIYSASKHALIGLTKCMALELAEHNITVNAICPGLVETPLWDVVSDDKNVKMALFQRLREFVPTKKGSLPEDIAELGIFLSGDAAKNITGSSYVIDGGQTAQ